MAKLNHSPKDIDEGFPEGIYSFKVTEVDLVTFSTGSQGMKVQLDVWNDNTGFTTRENLVTSAPKAKWKLKEFCASLGLDYDDEDLDTKDFVGPVGKVGMIRKPGDKWLSVDHYLASDAVENQVDKSEDNVPF